MFKQSIYIVFLKIFEFIVAISSLFIITSGISPVLYSIIAMKALFDGIMIFIPNLGAEDIFIRNFLYWKDNNDLFKISYYYKFALKIKSTLIPLIEGILIILIFFYFSKIYDESKNLVLFLYYFAFTSIFTSYSNTYKLFHIGTNNYLVVHLSSFFFNTLYRIILLFIFSFFGIYIYLILFPIGEIIQYFFLRYNFKERKELLKVKIPLKDFISKILSMKKFIGFNYVNFTKQYLDKIMISVLLPIQVFSTYSLAVQFETIGKSTLESFFDPLIQKIVSLKSNNIRLTTYHKNLSIIRYLFVILSLMAIFSYHFSGQYLISVLGLDNYPYLYYYVFFVLLTILISLFSIIERPIIFLLFNPSYKIFISISALVSLIAYVLAFVLPLNNLYLVRVFSAIIYNVIILFLFRKSGGVKNEKNIYFDV